MSILSLCALFVTVLAHGHMNFPRSRTQVAYESGEDHCPHCTLVDNVSVGPSGRPFPGNRPFAEPGTGDINGGPSQGPCGFNSGNNYNMPQRSWGQTIEKTYSAGETIEVQWCDNADHKGVYSYRICQDDSIVSPFLNPNSAPSTSQYNALEACFQQGILPCYDVEGNNCDIGDSCQPDWGCAQRRDWFHCSGSGCRNDGVCDQGFYVKDYVKLPETFTSNHTLLGFRWDVMDTPQMYLNCADIRIV
eukprot:Lithocolla_globosa_v1_NODE_7689_length_913_cov_1134.116550.p1 type:complete len:247 gc:universal NODE_7689_length_913_cov_1134.116550:64-804(+)